MRRAALVLCTLGSAALFGAAGCGDGGGNGDPGDASDMGQDGGDGPHGDDGGLPDSGITIEFVYIGPDGEPVPPGGGDLEFPELNFKIKQVTMQLHRLELVGDTADPGDLSADSYVLTYPSSNHPRISFPSASEGLYSRLRYRVERTYSDEDLPPDFEDRRLSIRVRGEALVEPRDRDFEYFDDKKIDVDLGDFTAEVTSGEHTTVVVEFDLASWFATINWQEVADRWDQGGGDDDDGGEDDDGGPGGDDDSGPGGDDDGGDDDDDGDDDDGGEDDDNSGPGNGNGEEIVIGLDGDKPTADVMRRNLRDSFRVR
jgi:hypothetical protein